MKVCPLAGRALTKGVEPLARLVSQERRQAEATDKGHALVAILLGKAAFNLQGLIPWAPTGITTPPAPVHFGGETFYYYGPGGGGVAYPDFYFFNLRGKDASIDFRWPLSRRQ